MEDLESEFYTRSSGHTESAEYLDGLDVRAKVKLLARINMVATHGLSAGIQHNWVKSLGKNLYEIRSRVGSSQQRDLYFHVDGVHYVTTHGFTRKTRKVPPREINHAKKLRDEYFIDRKEQQL